MRISRLLPTLLIPAALVAAGCGSSSSKSSSSSSPSTGGAPTVAAHGGSLGTILVDGQGRTLYLFEKDTNGRSHCSGACAQTWPPVTTTGAPKAGSGLTASLLGTTARSDGSMQVTYHGHPLYEFSGDSGAGQTNGQGSKAFGAEWYVLAPSGNKVERKSSAAGNGSSSSGTSTGYGY
jgi:predicted lipoprotein with Yx(FWY)xxD motif